MPQDLIDVVFVVFICYFFNTFLNEGSICDSRYIETLFSKMLLCCFSVSDTSPTLFAMKQKKVRFLVYLGNRQIIGAVLSRQAFELNSSICCTENAVFCFLNALSGIKNVFN